MDPPHVGVFSVPVNLTIFVPEWGGGGVERVTLNLLERLDREKYRPTLLLSERYLTYDIPEDVQVHVLGRRRLKWALPAIVAHFRKSPPDLLLSHMSLGNSWSILGRAFSLRDFRIICVEHNTLSVEYAYGPRLRKMLPALMRMTHRHADAIVAVSRTSAEDLAEVLGPAPPRIEVIYNPVASSRILDLAAEEIDHPWFNSRQYKVILSVGRLSKQKNYPLLIEAFARVLQDEPHSRLVIIGEGEKRAELERQVRDLSIAEAVAIPGFIQNPYPYMKRAAVFVLSSIYEGLPTVLVEAMACGSPVVATDCPGGVREILDDGRYGVLVPEDDVDSLAREIRKQLGSERAPRQSEERAQTFSVEQAMNAYEELFSSVLAR